MMLIKLACFLLACGAIEAAKILVIPGGNTSHFLEIDGVARPLHQRGHKIYVLLDAQTTLPKTIPYELITYDNADSMSSKFDTKEQHKFIESSNSGGNMSLMFTITKMTCARMMADQKLFEKLQSLNLDLALVDNFFMHCFYLMPHKLGIPFVSVGSMLTSWTARLPVLPSVVKPPLGLEMFGLHFCEESAGQSGFVRRVCRLIAQVMNEIFPYSFESDYMREHVNFTSMLEVRQKALLYLFNWNYLLSTPLPKLPNVEYVGGLTTKPAKPLEAELSAWMAASPNVVVVSFGSNFGSLPKATTLKLLEAFTKLPQYRFIWRFKQEERKGYQIPSNVRMMDWLPQNDVLGHNSTVAFITHSGNNGQQEALYHGVPMYCFYILGDQKTNAKRVVNRGYGKMIDIHQFTAEDVVSNLTELIQNPSYTQRIKKASAIFHSEKHPSERAADAVEHVLKYGGEHLQPKEALQLNFIEYYMLDILAIVYFICLFLAWILIKLAWCVVKRCVFGKSSRKVKSD